MNSNEKTKVVARALVITLLLALQSNADFRMEKFNDCGPDGWRLSNVEIENKEDRWSIETDVVSGSNPSIVHTANITMLYCLEPVPCNNNTPIWNVKDVSCDSPNLDPAANRTCEVVKDMSSQLTLLDDMRKYYNISNAEFCIQYTETSVELNTRMDLKPIFDSSSSSESSDDRSDD